MKDRKEGRGYFRIPSYDALKPHEKKARQREIAGLFFKLGSIAFGGPAAHIAMMEDEVVTKRKWTSREEFMDLVGATNLMPGPNSTELAIHLGYGRGGMAGLFVAGAAFILPAMLISLLFAWAYVRYGGVPQVEGVLMGIKPVIMAVILQALWRLGKSAVKGPMTLTVGLAVAGLNYFGVSEILLLFLAAAAVVLIRNWRKISGHALSLSLAPLMAISRAGDAAAATTGLGNAGIFLAFLKIGSFLYGSGYVLLAFLEREFVGAAGGITRQQLLDAIALGQFKPGPVFTTATFVGYLMHGVPGALAATVGIFLPPFLLVLFLHPLIPKIRSSPVMSAALDGVNVASLGIMAVVTLKLGLASIVDPFTAALFLLGLTAVMKYKVNSFWVVLAGGASGFIITGVL